jgi:hypothetical protein
VVIRSLDDGLIGQPQAFASGGPYAGAALLSVAFNPAGAGEPGMTLGVGSYPWMTYSGYATMPCSWRSTPSISPSRETRNVPVAFTAYISANDTAERGKHHRATADSLRHPR